MTARLPRTPLAIPAAPSVDVHRLHTGTPLSVEACRRILGPGCTDTDEEIAANRDRLMAIARALLEIWED